MKRAPTLVGASLFAVMGCGPRLAPTSGVDAADMYSAFTIITDVNETRVVAQLFRFERIDATESGTSDSLYLAGSDALAARVEDQQTPLEEASGLPEEPTVYLGRLEPVAVDVEVGVALTREEATLISRVTVPPAPILLSEAAFSRSAGLDLELDATDLGDDFFLVDLAGSCIAGTGQSAEAGVGVVHVDVDDGPGEDCDATIVINRVRVGERDPAYGDGDIEAWTRSEEIVVRSLP